jgi:hypothetical protein
MAIPAHPRQVKSGSVFMAKFQQIALGERGALAYQIGRKSKLCTRSLLTALLMLVAATAPAQIAKTYRDGHKGTVTFPLGDLSFADEVVSFQMGEPHAAPLYSDPKDALGPPDYDEKTDTKYTTLGCGGVLTLRFTDNVLIDVKGPDLYVFEIGPDIEPTRLEISKDGEQWVDIGEISGGTAAVDIGPHVSRSSGAPTLLPSLHRGSTHGRSGQSLNHAPCSRAGFDNRAGKRSRRGCCCCASQVSNIWRKIALMGSVWPVRATGGSLVEVGSRLKTW